MQSDRHLIARTINLSLFGCFVSTPTPFPEGTKVSLRISHGGATVATFGKVAFSKPDSGMGVSFVKLEPSGQAILEKWISTLRSE